MKIGEDTLWKNWSIQPAGDIEISWPKPTGPNTKLHLTTNALTHRVGIVAVTAGVINRAFVHFRPDLFVNMTPVSDSNQINFIRIQMELDSYIYYIIVGLRYTR